MQPSTVPTETLQSRMSGFNERLKKATNVTEQVAVMEDMKKDSEVYDSWSKVRLEFNFYHVFISFFPASTSSAEIRLHKFSHKV